MFTAAWFWLHALRGATSFSILPGTRFPQAAPRETHPSTHLRGSCRDAVGKHPEAGEEDLHAVPAGLVLVGRLLGAAPHRQQPGLWYGAVARVGAATIAPGVQGVAPKYVIHGHVHTAHMHGHTNTLVAVK